MAQELSTSLLFANTPASLFSKADQEKLERLFSCFSEFPSGILELPLITGMSPVGLGVHLSAKGGGFKQLKTPEKFYSINNATKNNWQLLQQFAHKQTDHTQSLNALVSEGWLEFDLDETTDALPSPSFFFKINPPFNRPPKLGGKQRKQQDHLITRIQQGLELLNASATDESLATLECCLNARHASTKLAYVGVMLGRQSRGFRLTFGNMPIDGLTAFLKKAGYQHSIAALLPLIQILWKRLACKTIALNIDIDGSIQPNVGIECIRQQDGNVAGAWRDFLGMLTHVGLCSPDRAVAMPAWHCELKRDDKLNEWPDTLGTSTPDLCRTINHVKFSYQPNPSAAEVLPGNPEAPLVLQAMSGEISAKAYLAFHRKGAL